MDMTGIVKFRKKTTDDRAVLKHQGSKGSSVHAECVRAQKYYIHNNSLQKNFLTAKISQSMVHVVSVFVCVGGALHHFYETKYRIHPSSE